MFQDIEIIECKYREEWLLLINQFLESIKNKLSYIVEAQISFKCEIFDDFQKQKIDSSIKNEMIRLKRDKINKDMIIIGLDCTKCNIEDIENKLHELFPDKEFLYFISTPYINYL